MKCQKCNELFFPGNRHAYFSVFDRYSIVIAYPFHQPHRVANLSPLFAKLVEDIRAGQNVEDYRQFDFYIQEEIEQKCPHCGEPNSVRFQLSIQDEFFLYIEDTIAFEIDNILLRYVGATAEDCGIDTLDPVQVDGLLSELPATFDALRGTIKRLFEIKHLLPIHGGRGGGIDILNWITDQVSAEMVGALVSFAITSGTAAIGKTIKGLSLRSRIRRKVRDNAEYWDDISFDQLSKHISIPKNYDGSKEEVIEGIILQKVDAYKSELVEKLRRR